MIDVQILTHRDEIDQARHLVYEDYYVNREWFPTNNLSGILIKQIGDLKIFADDYDQVSTWFGAYITGKMVGCCRLCGELNGILELERYRPLSESIKQDQKVSELNRCATHPKFVTDIAIFAKLIGAVIEYAVQTGYSVFSTTGLNSVSRYTDLGFELCDIAPFKFSELDKNEVEIVYSSNHIQKKEEIIRRCAFIAESQQESNPEYYETF